MSVHRAAPIQILPAMASSPLLPQPVDGKVPCGLRPLTSASDSIVLITASKLRRVSRTVSVTLVLRSEAFSIVDGKSLGWCNE